MSFPSPCTRWGKKLTPTRSKPEYDQDDQRGFKYDQWYKQTVSDHHSMFVYITHKQIWIRACSWIIEIWDSSENFPRKRGLSLDWSPTVSSAWEWQKTKRVAETSLSHIVTQWRELLKITSAATFPLVGKTIVKKKHFVLNVSTSMEWKYQISTLHLIPILSQFYVWKFQLALNRNPWRCDCHLRPFREWLAIQVFRN